MASHGAEELERGRKEYACAEASLLINHAAGFVGKSLFNPAKSMAGTTFKWKLGFLAVNERSSLDF